MREKVVIVGGGVAGLTAAHELIERDFDVVVYERRDTFGGKAASSRTTDGRPGEHGFRFFPGWYRHLPDTLRRIPYRGRRPFFDGKTSVFDNLVPVERNLIAEYERGSFPAVIHFPRSAGDVQAAVAFWKELRKMGLPASELIWFFGKLAEFLRTPEAVRRTTYDAVTWWDFLDADNKNKSDAFRVLIVATTRTMVAAKPKEASAYTIAKVVVRMLFGGMADPDRVLNGPTNEVWVDPWVTYLQARGVVFRTGFELASVEFDGSAPAVQRLVFERVVSQDIQRLIHFAERWTTDLRSATMEIVPPEDDDAVERLTATLAWSPEGTALVERLKARDGKDLGGNASIVRLLHRLGEVHALLGHWPNEKRRALAAVKDLKDAWVERPERDALLPFEAAVARAQAAMISRYVDPLEAAVADVAVAWRPELQKEKADHYIFAIPVEQMAEIVNRSGMLGYFDPSLRNIIPLSECVDWMAGIQFYLNEPLEITAGHIACMDSEWSLTAIEQTQFWRDVSIPRRVKAILSVDIAAWDRKGRFNQKEAFNCTPHEIAAEVWAELEASLNKTSRKKVLGKEMLVSGDPATSCHIDDSIVDRFDRKKQAAYQRSWQLAFDGGQRNGGLDRNGALADVLYVAGDHLEINIEPLLINRCGSLELRPAAATALANVFLAADYVDTNTNLACMEGANEAARAAVNAILAASGSNEALCETWEFSDADLLGRLMLVFRLFEPLAKLPNPFDAVSRAADAARDFATDAAERILGRRRDE